MDLYREFRRACRLLIAQPGWTLAAVTCLAIATGANTAAFSVINGILLRPLPFPEPRRLVMVALKEPDRSQTRPFSLAEFHEVAGRAAAFAQLSARTFLPVSLAADGFAQMAEAELVSANYFDMLRIAPAAGRFLSADDDRPGAAPSVVLSDRIWRERFGGDPSAVGRPARVNGRVLTIAGVAPAGFVGATQLIASDLWMPAALYRTLAGPNRSNSGDAADVERVPMFGVMGRLRPGVTREQARAQLEVIQAGLARDSSQTRPPAVVIHPATGFGVPPIARTMVISASMLLFGLMALLVAVAAANVVSLVLARAAGREREIAVRIALGASTWRIARELLIESLVLALIGAAGGVLIASWVTRATGSLGGQPFQYVSFALDIRPDVRVLAYAAAAAVVTAVAFGLIPARQVVQVDLIEVLKRAAGGSAPRTRVLPALVVGQIAASTTLLVGAGLLVRTYLNTQAIDPVIDTRNVLAVSLDLAQLEYDPPAGRRFYDEVLTSVAMMPGVETASLTRETPLSSTGRDVSVWIDRSDPSTPLGAGREPVPAPRAIGSMVVTSGHFDALRIPLVRGRAFSPLDSGRPTVAIVNETMARRFWPDGPSLGRTFHVNGPAGDRLEVIGVAKDVKERSLTEPSRPVFYQPFAQHYSAQMTLLVRARFDARALVDAVTRTIRSKNRDLSLVAVRTLDDQLANAIAPRRQSAFFLSVVCLLGLLLSSVGLYGVISYSVRQRVRELGIRMALGARAADVRLLVLGQGLRLVFLGAAIGIAGSLVLTHAVSRMLFGVSPTDPATLVIVCGVLGAVALLASYLPARWATRVDPVVVLRSE